MLKKYIQPRPNWQQTVEAQGFSFHTIEGQTYWDESTYYELTHREMQTLENATNELHALCLHAVEEVIQRGNLRPVAHSGVVYPAGGAKLEAA